MKEIYAQRIIKDDGLFRALFEIVWNNRKNEEPETFHPDYIETKRAMERVLNSEAEESQADLWRIIRCFSETYYLMGLREGANMIHTLLPTMNVYNDSFGSNNASPAEIGQLQFLLKQLVELDPAKKELVDRIEEKTSNYTNLSKKACSSLSEAVDAMIKNIEKALEELGAF